MKAFSVIILAAACSISCSFGTDRYALEPYSCEIPAPTVGTPVAFVGEVVAEKTNSLHIDFEESGADFSSIDVRFSAPEKWAGLVASIYFQGNAVLNGVPVEVGSSIQFQADPPACLDQPWLFLSDL